MLPTSNLRHLYESCGSVEILSNRISTKFVHDIEFTEPNTAIVVFVNCFAVRWQLYRITSFPLDFNYTF